MQENQEEAHWLDSVNKFEPVCKLNVDFPTTRNVVKIYTETIGTKNSYTQWTKLFLVKRDNILNLQLILIELKFLKAVSFEMEVSGIDMQLQCKWKKSKIRHKSKLDSVIVGKKVGNFFVNIRVLFSEQSTSTYFSEALKVAKKYPKKIQLRTKVGSFSSSTS